MGTYCYTRRTEVREIDDLRIGRFGYAYKLTGWGDERSRRRERFAQAQAESAHYKTKDIDLFIVGEFTEVKKGSEPRPVYQCSRDMMTYYDGSAPGEIVGYLYRDGRSIRFAPVIVEKAA